ncbi:unnamed protein product [Candidula unifasciata]|uniref:Cadherin domain-containing protein n=1 Tax=Candidula unifasciata TaxID=100452 RepID=A0A8S3ZXY2_9EUPU|nr:unnamed protein product [Candidula unifasciata]
MSAAVAALCVLYLTTLSVLAQEKTYSFREEEPEGTFVGNIALDLNLAALIPADVFSKLHYSIMNWGDGSHFRVDENDSGLFTKYKLDREQLCRFEAQCVLKLRVAARSETDVKKYSIFVDLLDVNDNPPKFNTSSFTLNIPESVTVGKRYALPGAADEDRWSENSIHSYNFEPPNIVFSVEFFKQLDGSSSVNLVVNATLDREITENYNLVLVAKDGGIPARSASLMVHIQVIDDNDNTPKFTQSQYSVQMGENTQQGSVIMTLSAVDSDVGVNSDVSYRLSSRQETKIAELFHVDKHTGQLTAKTPLTSGSYTIIIEAVDNGSPQRVNQTEVIVNVIDTENNPPVITIDPLNQDSKHVHVSETANRNSLVAHVSVFDPDSGPNGIVLCYSQSAFFDLHALHDNDYMLVVVRALDREQSPEYRVALFCEDSGTPRLNTTNIFDVIVDDVNDNHPVFDKTSYQISLHEGNALNDVAMILSASDSDVGINSKIYFTLLNDSNGFFKIPVGSNILVCAKQLDRETQDTHVVEVVARDGGFPSLSSTATVTISVLDINDEAPRFLQASYRFSIPEGLPAKTFVGSVSALDLDLAEGGEFEYSLVKTSTESHQFQILDNGTLITLTVLDRETSASNTLIVQVNDKGRPKLSSQVKVQIEVMDVNDNAPVFLFPSAGNNSVTLILPVVAEKTLFRLQASDADESDNGDVYFSLYAGNSSQKFDVDPATGELHAIRTLNSDDIGVYNLTITATDRGLRPLNTTRRLLIHVVNPVVGASQKSNTNTATVIGVVCGIIFVLIIIVAVACCAKKVHKEKPLRYLDKNQNSSEEKVKTGATVSNQYSSHKQSNIQTYPRVSKTPDIMVRTGEAETSDKELNRITSLRLQQAFQHINSIKSTLNIKKPREWREIHIPGQAHDFSSLSSRGTSTHNFDSGLGTDDDTAPHQRITSPPRPQINASKNNTHHTTQQHLPLFTSRPPSHLSASSSCHQSTSSLSSQRRKPAAEFVLFRPLSARISDLYPNDTIDDQCTTTSGSYSIDTYDHKGSCFAHTSNLDYIHDIYV